MAASSALVLFLNGYLSVSLSLSIAVCLYLSMFMYVNELHTDTRAGRQPGGGQLFIRTYLLALVATEPTAVAAYYRHSLEDVHR